jgi:SAM-dependent methyltransferase
MEQALGQTLRTAVPEWIKRPIRDLRNALFNGTRAMVHGAGTPFYYGTGRVCPICERSSRRFRSYGLIRREEAQCVHCGALERHRLLWLYVSRKKLLDSPISKMLHVAPEECLQPLFKQRLGSAYLTADLQDPEAMVKMDITRIQFPADSFDAIYCSHVLEHVPDDRLALREFHRVLRPGGWAILLVPVVVERTIEDPNCTDPEERLRRFGQDDHFRLYGPDYVDRLREAGFEVQVTRPADFASEKDVAQMGLTDASGEIYFCTKVADS